MYQVLLFKLGAIYAKGLFNVLNTEDDGKKQAAFP